MKRPFAVIGFTMLFIAPLLNKMDIRITVAVFIAAAVILLFLLSFKRMRKELTAIFIMLSVVIFTASFLISQHSIFTLSRNYGEKQVDVTGFICETPRYSDYAYTYVIQAEQINNEKESFKLRYVSSEELNVRQGDGVKIKCILHNSVDDADFVESNISKKVFFTAFSQEDVHIVKTGKINIIYSLVGRLKDSFNDSVSKYLPTQAGGLVSALTIGDRSNISSETMKSFNYAGTVHILVVSGLHLTVWALAITDLMMKNKRTRKYSAIVGIPLIFMYCALAGFTVSVIRAGIMTSAVVGARGINRNADSINSLGMALSFILLVNPFCVFSMGMWFSVLSTLGILTVSKTIKGYFYKGNLGSKLRKSKLYGFLADTTAVCFSSTLFTLPVFVFKVKTMPVFSVLSNLLMINIAMVIMVFSVFAFIFHILHLFSVARWIYTLCGLAGNLLMWVADKIASYPFSTVRANQEAFKLLFIVLVLLVLFTFIMKKRNRDILKHTVAVSVALVILTVTYCCYADYNTPVLMVFNGQNGLFAVAKSGNSTYAVGDIAQKDVTTLDNLLQKRNIKEIDYVTLTGQSENDISRLLFLNSYYNGIKPVKKGVYRVDGKMIVSSKEADSGVIISVGEKTIAVNNMKENIFQKGEKCDIIIERFSENSSKSFVIDKGEAVSIYFRREKVKWLK